MDWQDKLDNWLFYKYRHYLDEDNRDLGIIYNNKVWFDNPSNFNDPYDCSPKLIIRTHKEAVKEIEDTIADKYFFPAEYISKLRNKYECDPTGTIDQFRNMLSTREAVEQHMNQFLVFSLAKKPLNRLMWSHYSSNHRGFVIEFNLQRTPIEELPKDASPGQVISSSFLPHPVVYQRDRPASYDNINNDGSPKPLVTKDEVWKYEEEYRILRQGQRGLVEFDPMALSAVILGARVTPSTKAKIQDAVYEVNRKRRTTINIYYAELSETTYDIHIPGHPFYENS